MGASRTPHRKRTAEENAALEAHIVRRMRADPEITIGRAQTLFRVSKKRILKLLEQNGMTREDGRGVR